MLLGSMDLLQCNKLESSSVFLCVGYPLFSNRAMISPTRPLMTPSGLIAMKVCSADILGVSTICSCELKSFESWNPWAVVMRVRSTVTIRKAFDMHVAKFPLVNLQEDCSVPNPASPRGPREILQLPSTVYLSQRDMLSGMRYLSAPYIL